MSLETRAKIERFSIPEPNSGCWIWLGCHSKGYGYVRHEGKMMIASRVSHLAFICDPREQQVCHTCDNTFCVNPDHFFLGTVLDNMEDRENKGRTWKKIPDEELDYIRSSRMKGVDLADMYGVSGALISIIRNKKWRA